MRFLRSFSTRVLVSALTAGSMLGLPQYIDAQELRIIADAQTISAAHPDHEQLHSLFLGQGTGMYPQVNSRGDVLFGAHTVNGDPTDMGRAQLYRYRADTGVEHLLGDGNLLQGGAQATSAMLGAALNQQFKPTITHDGEALMMCRLSGEGITYERGLGVVRVQSEGASDLLVQNQTSLDSLPVSSIVGAIEPEENPTEQLLAVQLNAAGTDTAILRRASGSIAEVVRTGMPAPGTGDAQFDQIPYPLRTLSTVNARGDVVFGATLTGPKVSQGNNGGLWRQHDGELELVARDGVPAVGDSPDCNIYGSAYARPQLNTAGHVAFHAGATCGSIAVYSDRSGALRREAYADKLFDGPSGRFRIGLLNEVTTTLGSLGDTVNYLRGFLSDSEDLFVLSNILNEDRSTRSSWGIVRIALDGSAEILLESSALYSGVGFPLPISPFPEQLSFARDGTMLARIQESNNGPRMLVIWAPGRGRMILRDGQQIGEYVINIGGSNHVNGAALSEGLAFADVRAFAPQDDRGTSGRNALLRVNTSGELSLPVIRGITVATDAANQSRLVQNFGSPFFYTTKRRVASDSGVLTMIGVLEPDALGQSEAILLLQASAPGVDPADFNQDGVVSVPDIFAFLSAFFAGNIRADIDHNGTVDVPDIFAFLSLYFQG